MAEITTARSGNVLVPYVDAKKRTKEVPLTIGGTDYLSTTRATGIAYADSAGIWHLSGNMRVVSNSVTTPIFTISGVVFKNVASFYQPSAGCVGDAAEHPVTPLCVPNTNQVVISYTTAQTVWSFVFDFELESKPTWADANLEDVTAVDMFIAENSLPGSKLLDASIPMSKLVSMYEPRNFMINGALDFWQRGTSFSSAGYSADRFYTTANGSVTISRSTTYLPDVNTRKSLSWVTGASSSYTAISQPIEQDNVMLLRGKYVTFSADVMTRGTAFASTFWVGSYYSNSSDARASLTTPIGDVGISPAASGVWKRITYTFLVPTDAVGLAVAIDCNSVQASGVEVYTSNWMLNIGSVAAPFQRAGGTIGGELALCQRFYEKSYNVDVAPGTSSTDGLFIVTGKTHPAAQILNSASSIQFKVNKRTEPSTISFWKVDGTPDYWSSDLGNLGTIYASLYGESSFYIGSNTGSGMTYLQVGYVSGHWVASAEL